MLLDSGRRDCMGLACRHHWIIAPADPAAGTGLASPGYCRLCGETRFFVNYIERDEPKLVLGKQAHQERWRG